MSCPLGTLGAGASGSFTITVTLGATATGSIVNSNDSIGAVNAAGEPNWRALLSLHWTP